MEDKTISIWFFIGTLILFYGVLICGYGIYRLIDPPATAPVLAELHADIWWGALLILGGVIYTFRYSPGKR
jgi:heme/copper-type cytochrome/quinol oxidase subunit 3